VAVAVLVKELGKDPLDLGALSGKRVVVDPVVRAGILLLGVQLDHVLLSVIRVILGPAHDPDASRLDPGDHDHPVGLIGRRQVGDSAVVDHVHVGVLAGMVPLGKRVLR